MPTTATSTYSNAAVDPVFNADDAMASMIDVHLPNSATIEAGTILGPVTATPGTYKAYASGNSDGSQIPAGVLRRKAVTDGSGNITNQDEWGVTPLVTSMYTEGAFRCSELTGLDANAVTVLGGHLIGSITTGIFTF